MHPSEQGPPIFFLVVLLIFCRGILSCSAAILDVYDFNREREDAGVPVLK
jgi:hypothetical protein